MAEVPDPAALEERLEKLGSKALDRDTFERQYEVAFSMLQVIRLREQVAGTQALARHANSQVEQAQNLARYTLWMAVFVGLASIAQVATVLVAIFALP